MREHLHIPYNDHNCDIFMNFCWLLPWKEQNMHKRQWNVRKKFQKKMTQERGYQEGGEPERGVGWISVAHCISATPLYWAILIREMTYFYHFCCCCQNWINYVSKTIATIFLRNMKEYFLPYLFFSSIFGKKRKRNNLFWKFSKKRPNFGQLRTFFIFLFRANHYPVLSFWEF